MTPFSVSNDLNPKIGTGRLETGISDGIDILELAIGMIGFGIDSLSITFVGDTNEFIIGFCTEFNVSTGDTCNMNIDIKLNTSI